MPDKLPAQTAANNRYLAEWSESINSTRESYCDCILASIRAGQITPFDGAGHLRSIGLDEHSIKEILK